MIEKIVSIRLRNPLTKKPLFYEVRASVRAIALITLFLVMGSMIYTNYRLSVTNAAIAKRITALDGKLTNLIKVLVERDRLTTNIGIKHKDYPLKIAKPLLKSDFVRYVDFERAH